MKSIDAVRLMVLAFTGRHCDVEFVLAGLLSRVT
jgi:hypothetical protein